MATALEAEQASELMGGALVDRHREVRADAATVGVPWAAP
jgi:hypothetical protein